ncbi:MAG: metallophosphoesterase [Candidatus Microthrix sp.]|nr:metallophosphoesterase [Candidatus Microthrix sp.]MBK6440151.1 metallophosphoesterase [Candidatus Microthrix sp.]
MELTTVAPDEVTVHDGTTVHRHVGLEPATAYRFDGLDATTLPRPKGELLGTFATVNDVHFGETEAGLIDGQGEAFSVPPGTTPYPTLMNTDAVAEIAELDPVAVLVKGDLTTDGSAEQLAEFEATYRPTFGDRLHFIRGNHESYHHVEVGPSYERVELPGALAIMLDTSRDGHPNGDLSAEQLERLDDEAADSDVPVLVFGHHQIWLPDEDQRTDRFFGILPDASEALQALIARRLNVRGYFAGHTHRNRRRVVAASGDVPYVEVASVKDFPGAWAEYRLHEGTLVQVLRRVSTARALEWTDRTRGMFGGVYPIYSFGELGDRCFSIDLGR